MLMVLGSCASRQVGAALAARLFPVTGSAGATLLRLGLAAGILGQSMTWAAAAAVATVVAASVGSTAFA